MESGRVAPDEQGWHVALRWQQFEGEARTNLLRVAAVGAFYVLHSWNYASSQGKLPNYGFLQLAEQGRIDPRFHLQASMLALAWAAVAASVHIYLHNRSFPWWLSTLSTSADLALLTSVLCISNGPRSPLVAGYFLVIALAGLRFDLFLVRLATVGAAVGYVCALGVAKWPERFGREAGLDLSVPRYNQLATLAAIALCGVFIGQIVRRSRRLAADYAARINKAPEP